jgi:catechol 2,3-dioxygenase-like lactoylglutathione lyase family enzyme
MVIDGLNHVNIATKDLENSARFYESLGLARGHRPDFHTTGIWMYSGLSPVLHLNDEEEVGPIVSGTAAVHHFGFSVRGTVGEVCKELVDLGIEFDLWDPIPGVCRALYFRGPSGESIEYVMVDEYVP